MIPVMCGILAAGGVYFAACLAYWTVVAVIQAFTNKSF